MIPTEPSPTLEPPPSLPPPESDTPSGAEQAAVVVTARRPSRSGAVLALQARALGQRRFDAAAAAVLDHLVAQLGCDRVSLGLYEGRRLRVVAVSGSDDPEQRQGLVQRIGAAMTEAVEQRLAIVHPLPPGAAPAMTAAHDDLAQANGHASLYTVPVVGRERPLGALLFERHEGFDPETLEAARDAALFVGPLLALQRRADAGPWLRLQLAARGDDGPEGAGLLRRSMPALALATTVLAIALAWPVTWRVVAPARVEGAIQQVVAAPVNGFIGSVAVRPGAEVKAGQPLLMLDVHELELERNRWLAETAQLDKRYSEALAQEEAAPIVLARAQLEQAQSQLRLAEHRLERATLRAPMDGVLISGDLTQKVGMPVERGQELMTLAPATGWRVVAEVEEQAINPVREGQWAQVLLPGASGEPVRFRITRIAPVATQADGRNVFEVEGTPEAASAALRPGLRGVVRIEVGERALGAIWWDRAWQAWRRLSWRLLG